MGLEILTIFAPPRMVAPVVVTVMKVATIGMSVAANAFAFYNPARGWLGIAAAVGGAIIPLFIAGATYTIGHAVHNGGRS